MRGLHVVVGVLASAGERANVVEMEVIGVSCEAADAAEPVVALEDSSAGDDLSRFLDAAAPGLDPSADVSVALWMPPLPLARPFLVGVGISLVVSPGTLAALLGIAGIPTRIARSPPALSLDLAGTAPARVTMLALTVEREGLEGLALAASGTPLAPDALIGVGGR